MESKKATDVLAIVCQIKIEKKEKEQYNKIYRATHIKDLRMQLPQQASD